MSGQPVLIVGAGPTGLVLALWLTRLGVNVRIIDKAAEPGTTSRALAVQTRTLEFYQQIGLATTVVERGIRLLAANSGSGAPRSHAHASAMVVSDSARFPTRWSIRRTNTSEC